MFLILKIKWTQNVFPYWSMILPDINFVLLNLVAFHFLLFFLPSFLWSVSERWTGSWRWCIIEQWWCNVSKPCLMFDLTLCESMCLYVWVCFCPLDIDRLFIKDVLWIANVCCWNVINSGQMIQYVTLAACPVIFWLILFSLAFFRDWFCWSHKTISPSIDLCHFLFFYCQTTDFFCCFGFQRADRGAVCAVWKGEGHQGQSICQVIDMP